MNLSEEQQNAFEKYNYGENVFITGPGGSGKSALIKHIYLHSNTCGKKIHVCALTGCAAILLNCKSKTLHSWSGVGLANGTIEQLVTKICKNKNAKALWRETNVLVVDEVSMLSLKLFDILNEIGKKVRGNMKPFGGIQLIFSGDFFQLPPVGDYSDPDTQKFCFESKNWDIVFPLENQIQLMKIFRQTNEIYSSILNQIRYGVIKRKSYHLLLQYVNRQKASDLIIEPTLLFPTRCKVDNINNTKMSSLDGEEKEYKLKYVKDLEKSKYSTTTTREIFDEKDILIELEFLSNNLICEKNLKLKIGAQVMCIVNIQSESNITVCNGSQGIITEFCEITNYPKVKFNNGIHRVMTPHTWISDKISGIGVSQIPLILAWALTIHKSQGATLDAAEIDAGSDIFECGQTYVALSRVKSLEGLYLSSFDVSKIRIHPKVKKYYERLDNNK
jgi:ATP-dependent DNA helicase PIF1